MRFIYRIIYCEVTEKGETETITEDFKNVDDAWKRYDELDGMGYFCKLDKIDTYAVEGSDRSMYPDYDECLGY